MRADEIQQGDLVGEVALVGDGTTASPTELGWISLGTSPTELCLANTLPTGQTFRWRKTSCGDWVGVIGERVVSLRQAPTDVLYRVHCGPHGSTQSTDHDAIAEYFNLAVNLSDLSQQWAAADVRFRNLQPYLPGCRMLRQDPSECLFSFICSSNNHISRIHGMVERLCAGYGTELFPDGRLGGVLKAVPVNKKKEATPQKKQRDADAVGAETAEKESLEARVSATKAVVVSPSSPPATPSVVAFDLLQAPGEPLGTFYSFPTVTQLLGATEEQLRAMVCIGPFPNPNTVCPFKTDTFFFISQGFGYRAKFIAGTAAALSEKEGGADSYLRNLRDHVLYRDAQVALTELPGVGPKVAACACLFSLDKHQAVPVDTHVWQLAVEHYLPSLEGKTLTPKIMEKVEDTIVGVFGEYAGWAHNTLFVAELAHVRAALPEKLRTPPRAKTSKEEKKDTMKSPANKFLSEEQLEVVVKEESAMGSPVAKKSKKGKSENKFLSEEELEVVVKAESAMGSPVAKKSKPN
tara:strand:- start:3497 stop:5059 length:1563 start_codon:yes stop_codon:yes gene_type:complete